MTSKRLNIVVPMAGRGKRFADVGYAQPKPLIPVHGKAMIEWVIDNVRPQRNHRFIFISLEDHERDFQVSTTLKRRSPGCETRLLSEVTEGAACTVLTVKDLINTDEPLMIVNSDQWIDVPIDSYLESLDRTKADGLIMTMEADDKKWSFVSLDQKGFVNRVVEKEVISNEATVGIYNFSQGQDYVRFAERMIQKNLRVNNEFYVAPVYNEMIQDGGKTITYNIGKVSDRFFGLGTPEDLNYFLRRHPSEKALHLHA